MPEFKFTVQHEHKKSRTGFLQTAHGIVQTPAFMPVGTSACVKAMLPEQIVASGADIILSNTYHLMLRPGEDIIANANGLHKFMNWDKPILTDSGGFQVMSLAALRKVKEEGVIFRSHIDGSQHLLSPEIATKLQHTFGSTISMIFDECTPFPATYQQAQTSMELSLRWAQRSKDAFIARLGYGQFGIVQGSVFPDLRAKSAQSLVDMNFQGYAIGGLAVGETQNEMFQVLDYCPTLLPKDKPRYLMGVGKPSDIIGAVARGIDMFDCVIPTRSGRNGQAFTSLSTVNIRNSKYKYDLSSLDPNCDCYTCTNFSRSYLHHLVKSREITGSILMTGHNLYYFQDLMGRIRNYINQGRDFDFEY